MGKKDKMTREYLKQNERFADLCNYVLFDGRRIIDANSLEEQDVSELAGVLGKDQKKVYYQQRWRDLLKQAVIKSAGKVYIVLLGVENQTNVHYAMPVRNMLFDAINYAAQVKQTDDEYRAKREYGSKAEFLSGFHRDDHLVPVITITLYWGSDAWDAPRTLHEMFTEVDEHLKCFLPDYFINLIVPKEIEDFDKFHTALGAVLASIKASGDEGSMAELLEDNPYFTRLDNDSVRIIKEFTNIDITINEEEGVTDVCKAWDDHLERGRREGHIEGHREGRIEGQREGRIEGRREGQRDILVSLVKDGLLAQSVAAKRAKMSDTEFAKLL